MPASTLTFNDPINSSLQIGDIVYYSTWGFNSSSNIPTNQTVSTITTSSIVKFGTVISITPYDASVTPSFSSIEVSHDVAISPPLVGYFIMFEKDKKVNSSSLIGYFAEVKLMNYSTKKIELFSLAAGVSESSK